MTRVCATFSTPALKNNLEVIRKLVPGKMIIPMIKANAYGHGARWAAQALHTEKEIYALGVATLDEALEIRSHPDLSGAFRLLVFSGTSPWTETKAQAFLKFGLEPVISTWEDWLHFSSTKSRDLLKFHLKFNTGMNRLGIPDTKASEIVSAIRGFSRCELQTVLTHLATSENLKDPLSREQKSRFLEIRRAFSTLDRPLKYHFANSGAIWNWKFWGHDPDTDLVRPGLSLYGVRPFPKAPDHGLTAVMNLTSEIVQISELKKGDRLGYGGTYIHKNTKPLRIATCSAGYADGWHRTLSSKGWVTCNDKKCKVLGVISMDLFSCEAPKGAKIGDRVELWGHGTDHWELAQNAGTIPYELLTSVGARVRCIYE